MVPKTGPVRSLTFVSTTTHEFDDQELEHLFVQMSDFNRPRSIGGVLLYSQCNVVQCIEGPPEAIGLAFDRIRRSTRHKDIMVLTDELVPRRSFSKWKVGLARPTASQILAVAHADWKVRLTSATATAVAPPGLALMCKMWNAWERRPRG